MSSQENKIASEAFLALAEGRFIFGAGVSVSDVALRALAGSNIPSATEAPLSSVGHFLSNPLILKVANWYLRGTPIPLFLLTF